MTLTTHKPRAIYIQEEIFLISNVLVHWMCAKAPSFPRVDIELLLLIAKPVSVSTDHLQPTFQVPSHADEKHARFGLDWKVSNCSFSCVSRNNIETRTLRVFVCHIETGRWMSEEEEGNCCTRINEWKTVQISIAIYTAMTEEATFGAYLRIHDTVQVLSSGRW